MQRKRTAPPLPGHVRRRSRERRRRLQALGYKDYGHYLQSPQWRVVKARYRASHLPQRCMCGEVRVQLHHKTYERVGEELLTDLVPLCATCHELIHHVDRTGEATLDFAGITSPERAAAYGREFADDKSRSGRRMPKDDGTRWVLLLRIDFRPLPVEDPGVEAARLADLERDGLIEQRESRKRRMFWRTTATGRAALHDPTAHVLL